MSRMVMAMRAGRLRSEGAIQSETRTQDTFGESIRTWETDAITKFQIETLRGDEIVIGDTVVGERVKKVTMRFRDGMSSKNRIVYGSSALEIETALDMEDEDKREMFGSKLLQIIMVEEVRDRDHMLRLICEESP